MVYEVILEDGLKAKVYPGDPGEAVIKALSKAGYSTYYTSLRSVQRGRLDYPAGGSEEWQAAADDQYRTVDIPVVDCVHHWILKEPELGDPEDHGVCKFCGDFRSWRRSPHVRWKPVTPEDKKKYTDAVEEWKVRLEQAKEAYGA